MKIGILAPSSQIPQLELNLGINKLLSEGLSVVIHPQCKKDYLFFAGTDQQRFQALIDFATHPEINVLWGARGGFGSTRLLPLLKKWTENHPIPSKKLLIGYSDSTALMEFVRKEWGWSTLHAPMPSWKFFSFLKGKDWKVLLQWIHQVSTPPSWEHKKLEFWSCPLKKSIHAPLTGGNLSIWCSLVGTPFLEIKKKSILFLEDVNEPFYKIDRMLQQLSLSGSLDAVQAIVLGDFLNCKDSTHQVLKTLPTVKSLKKFKENLIDPSPQNLKPLRKVIHPPKKCLRRVFSEFGLQRSLPIAYGLPVGHGPKISSMPIGGSRYELTVEGQLILKSWDWLKS